MSELIILSSREEWLKHRKKYIGGSEVSAIVGLNPYMSNIDLWKIKTGRKEPADISNSEAVRYGNAAEHLLRELFALDYPEYKVTYIENNSYLNPAYPFAAASLDGALVEKATGRQGIFENKTTNILQSQQKERWNHRIPDNYYCQLLWYLLVTGWDFAILKAQLKSQFEGNVYLQTRHYKIERSEVEEDINWLAEKAAAFWRCVETDTQPALVLPEI